jgi:hypothetical protein
MDGIIWVAFIVHPIEVEVEWSVSGVAVAWEHSSVILVALNNNFLFNWVVNG